MFVEKVRGHIQDACVSLLKLRNITHFSLWENFPYLAKFRKVDEHSGSISIWSFVVMIFGTWVYILILLSCIRNAFIRR